MVVALIGAVSGARPGSGYLWWRPAAYHGEVYSIWMIIVIALITFGLVVVGAVLWTCISAAQHFCNDADERHRNRQRGKCKKCGYDLRATPERCPECGMGVVKERVERKEPLMWRGYVGVSKRALRKR